MPLTLNIGHVFIHEGGRGHIFDPHYLESMFPLSKGPQYDHKAFVDHAIVNDDLVSETIMRASTFKTLAPPSGSPFYHHHKVSPLMVNQRHTGGSEVSVTEEDVETEKSMQMTVRKASRLWKYMNGGEI